MATGNDGFNYGLKLGEDGDPLSWWVKSSGFSFENDEETVVNMGS